MNNYESPFQSRYGSEEIRTLFSPQIKHETWRELWLILAESEQKLGLNITKEQTDEMATHLYDIPFDRVAEIEQETHHDVMAHIKAYAEQCPKAAPIIHLGATSAYVTDNTDMLLMKMALVAICGRIADLMCILLHKAEQYKQTPTLAYTHFQPAQPTTFGKRMCMWLQDLQSDMEQFEYVESNMHILGCKGATGTYASFLELFGGDCSKTAELDLLVAHKIGMPTVPISGQTYSRKQDYRVFSALSGVAQTLSKMANDIRLMASKGEFYEPFGENQVGSSAMAYKQNPIKCEKVVSLARLVINNATAIANTAANQWLERSLDDSAIRRVLIPETFIMVDEILTTMTDVMGNGVVQEHTMLRNLNKEIPKLASEGILMRAVNKGGNRQELHEIIRQYTVWQKEDFMTMVCNDSRFNLTVDEVLELTSIDRLIGMAPKQVESYCGAIKEVLYGDHEED